MTLITFAAISFRKIQTADKSVTRLPKGGILKVLKSIFDVLRFFSDVEIVLFFFPEISSCFVGM